MIVVLIILGSIIIIFLWLILLMFSDIKINIDKIEINNIKSPKVFHNYCINVGFYFMNFIKIWGFNINKQKLEHLKILRNINFVKLEKTIEVDKDIQNQIKKIKPIINSLNFNLDIGTNDALLTSFMVFLISTALSLVLPHVVNPKHYDDIHYRINPIYKGENLFNISLNCIIYVKMVHIMSIIYIYLQKRRDKNYGRTSDRGAYANSYE